MYDIPQLVTRTQNNHCLSMYNPSAAIINQKLMHNMHQMTKHTQTTATSLKCVSHFPVSYLLKENAECRMSSEMSQIINEVHSLL